MVENHLLQKQHAMPIKIIAKSIKRNRKNIKYQNIGHYEHQKHHTHSTNRHQFVYVVVRNTHILFINQQSLIIMFESSSSTTIFPGLYGLCVLCYT